MAGVLVDSSAWIEYFNHPEGQTAQQVTLLLEARQVAMADPVRAEVLSGALDEKTFRRMESHLTALRRLDPPDDLWSKIARSRFDLARKGIQASLVDLMLAWTAVHHKCHVLTLDADFHRLPPIVPVMLFSAAATGKRPGPE